MSNLVTTAKPKTGGAVYRGAITATLPTTAGATLTGFTALGYVSDDGLTNSWEKETDSIVAWGGDTVYTYQTSVTDTFSFSLIESLNPNVLATVYGEDNVSGTLETSISVNVNSDEAKPFAWVVDMVLADGVAKRIVIPNAKVTEVGEITYKDDEAIGYEITLTCYADGTGNTHYEYLEA